MATPARTLSTEEQSDDTGSQICPGDIVRTGENLYPEYRVIATSEDRAWVRDVQYGTDHIVPIGTLVALRAPPCRKPSIGA
jgi:hypothetical protein